MADILRVPNPLSVQTQLAAVVGSIFVSLKVIKVLWTFYKIYDSVEVLLSVTHAILTKCEVAHSFSSSKVQCKKISEGQV